MSINFGSYFKQLNKMGYFLGNTWTYKKLSAYNNITLTFTGITTLPVTTQCSVVLNLKYDSSTSTCQAVTGCNLASLNAKYCSGENTPIVCADNYHYSKRIVFF